MKYSKMMTGMTVHHITAEASQIQPSMKYRTASEQTQRLSKSITPHG
jgi:hypothetical protein